MSSSRCRPPTPTVELTVDDDGPGIDPDDRERVFERFTRLDDGRARDAGGLGIGLAIVKAIVEQHGGTVTIDDAPIGGARFVVHTARGLTSASHTLNEMPQLTIVSFNAHAGLQPRRDGRCTPYDLVEVLRGFDDADVIVLQESFIPDDEPAAVQKVAAELGAQLHELPLGRVKLDPWPQLSDTDPAATGTTAASRS